MTGRLFGTDHNFSEIFRSPQVPTQERVLSDKLHPDGWKASPERSRVGEAREIPGWRSPRDLAGPMASPRLPRPNGRRPGHLLLPALLSVCLHLLARSKEVTCRADTVRTALNICNTSTASLPDILSHSPCFRILLFSCQC